MGTNYYLHRNVCVTCGRGEDRLHIGKRSAGWQFLFHGLRPGYHEPPLTTRLEWEEFLRAEVAGNGEIRDECHEPCGLGEFLAIVQATHDEPGNHATYCQQQHPEHAARDCWLDLEGWPFCASEFS